jgi:gliding motility-associated-like protein
MIHSRLLQSNLLKKFFAFFVLCSGLFISAFAQQTTFRINYDFNNFDFSSVAGDALTNGNYILTGWNTQIIPFTATVTEVNSAGNLVWSKRFTSSISMQINDLKRDIASNTYYTCGGTESGVAFIMVLNSTGTPTISRNFSISQADGAFLNRILKTSDGGYVAVGYVTGYDPDGAGPEIKFSPITYTDNNGESQTERIGSPLVVKFDANGNHLWHHVMRYYTAATKNPATERIYNDASFTDVVEVSDGYLAVGSYEVNQFRSATNSDGDDATPDDALFLKTTTAGSITYHRQIDAPSTSTSQSSKALYSIKKTAAGLPLIAGDDGSSMLFMRLPGSGVWAVPTWIRRYTVSGFGAAMIVSNFFETYDGNYAAMGQYLNPLAFQVGQGILKINPSNNSVIFSKSYDLGLFSILPNGSATADKGFISATLTAGGANFDMQIVKADSAGNAPVDCPAANITTSNNGPSYTYADPYYNSWNTINLTNNTFTPTITTPTPTQTVVCRTIACTVPPQPTVTASANNVCPGTQVTINAAGGSNVTYRVYTQASGGTSIGTTPLNVNPSATTTYYVEADDNSNPGCVSSRGSVTVTVLTLASISGNITGSTTPCLSPPSQAYTVNASGSNITYTWAVPGGGGNIANGQGTSTANINWTNSGNYTITVTVSNSCTPSATRTLAVNVQPSVSGVTASVTPANPVCSGNTLNLTGSGTGVTTWSWSGPNGFSANTQNASVPNIQTNGTGTYTLTGSSACGTGTSTVSVTVINFPQSVTASASPNPACAGNTVNLTANATGATSFTWSGPNSFSANTQNASVPNIQTNGAGTYTLSAINSCGTITATTTVIVNEAPTAVTATASPNPACDGGTVNLSGSATGATSYSWTGPNSFSSSQLNETINNFQQANVGTYTLNATNSCGSTQGTVAVTIASGPTNLTASANLTNICAASSLSLTSNSPNATFYSWTGPNGFTSNIQNPTIPVITVADSGTYTVTAINACGNATASVTVDVDTTIENVDAGALPNDTICVGETINLNVSGTNVNSWSWAGPNNYTSQQQNNSIPNATAANSGNYIVTASNACGNVKDTITVLVNTVPTSPVTITGTTFTCGGTEPYSINAVSNATGYTWSLLSGGTVTTGQGTPDIAVLWNGASGNYTLSVTAENICGISQPATITVTILPETPATPVNISGNVSVCPGIEPYTISNVQNATSYTWSISGGGTIASGQNTTSVNINWTTAGTYAVSVTASNSCGTSTAQTISVTVNPNPTNPSITVSSSSICEGESATITASNSTGGTVSYNFYDAVTGGNLLGTSPLTVSPTSTTIYYLEVTNEFGCRSSIDRIPTTVNVNSAPSDPTVAAENLSVCFGASTTLTATSTPAGSTITWWDVEINGTQLGTGNTYTVNNVTSNTTIYVQATSGNGCRNLGGRTDATVAVIPLPEVTLTSDKPDNAIFLNEVITFTAEPSGYDNYEFFVNSVSVQSGAENTYASSKFQDKDTISVIATNDGCTGEEQEAVIRVKEYPNAFTPNGDGKNDRFLKNFDLVVLNRWGQELYRGIDGWDGTFNGKKVSPGTYFYILTLTDITDRENVIKGTVMLVQE